MSASPPSDTNGNGTEPKTAPIECSRCGHIGEPIGKGQCKQCKCFLPGNAANLRHGLRRFQDTGVLPDDLAEYRDSRRAELVDALGGTDSLSPQREMLAGHVIALEVCALLQLDFALRQGADTKRGRAALSDYRASVQTLRRVLSDLGLERRAQEITLEEVLRQPPKETTG